MILSGDFQRVQVLLSGNENNQCLLTCIDCTYESGKVRLILSCCFLFVKQYCFVVIEWIDCSWFWKSSLYLWTNIYIRTIITPCKLFLFLIYYFEYIFLFLASQLSMVIKTYINMFKWENNSSCLASERCVKWLWKIFSFLIIFIWMHIKSFNRMLYRRCCSIVSI